MRDIVFCLRFLLALSWRTDRRRLITGGGLLLLGFVATPLAALALRGLVNAMVTGPRDAAAGWAVLAAALLIGELMLGHFAHLAYFELGEINEETLSRELLRVINGGPGLDRCDDPRFADSVDLLRQDILKMRTTVQAVLQLAGLVGQAALTMVILAGVLPWLLFLPLVAVFPVLSGKRAERLLESAREQAAPVARAIRHLRVLAASPGSQPEIRLAGSAEYLITRQEELQRRLARILGRGQRRHATLRALGQCVFALAYVGSLVLTFQLARRQEATIGDVVLVVVLATAVSAQVSGGIELLSSVHAAAAGFRRLIELRAAVTATRPTGDAARPAGHPAPPAGHPASGRTARPTGHPAPPAGDPARPVSAAGRLGEGITLEGVSFTYPDSTEPVLRDVDLRLPAGTSVALVGENGAGKSTLIKLLAALYQPTAGRILVDGADLATLDAAGWQARTAILFQDFARLNFSLRHSVGVGELADADADPAIVAAIGRTRSAALLRRLDLDTLLGKGYGDGTELSGGQWQSVGFARTLMRRNPLLLCLDEPGHALDPLAEQRMCDAYQEIAQDLSARLGTVTVYVTHRMSTVRLADLIVVLERGTVAEVGSHAELLARGGRYAELYQLQSHAYA